MIRSDRLLDEADATWIAARMGRTPAVTVEVARRCPAGHPCVVSCSPLSRGRGIARGRVSPFPTFYWLICPRLSREVSHLERDGAVARFDALLSRDAELRERFARDHEDYIARRWAAMSDEERNLVESSPRLREALLQRGIGGMTSRTSVKCLHLHVAHALVSANVIGELVMKEFGLGMCTSAKPQAAAGDQGAVE